MAALIPAIIKFLMSRSGGGGGRAKTGESSDYKAQSFMAKTNLPEYKSTPFDIKPEVVPGPVNRPKR